MPKTTKKTEEKEVAPKTKTKKAAPKKEEKKVVVDSVEDEGSKKTEKKPKSSAKISTDASYVRSPKKVEKHGVYHPEVNVECICGNKFVVASTMEGPIKVEICYACHPVYNPEKSIKKVIKGRMEKFLEKQKKIDKVQQ